MLHFGSLTPCHCFTSAERLDLFAVTDLKLSLPFSGCLSGGANQAVARTPAHNQLTCDCAVASRHINLHAADNHIFQVLSSASQIARASQQP